MADDFALTSDIAVRWHALTVDEQQRASALLADASGIIRAQCKRWQQEDQQVLKAVTCAMVIRALAASSSDMVGVSQLQETTGPFSQSISWQNPSGDLYLTDQERRSLHISTQRAGSISLLPAEYR